MKAMKAMRGAYKPGSGGGRCHEAVARAYAGAVAAGKGEAMTDARWEALRQFACGCLPQWEAVDRKTGARVRGVINETMGYVQGAMEKMMDKWRARAAGGMEWEKERGEKGEWMRLIVRAWSSEAQRARAQQPQQQQVVHPRDGCVQRDGSACEGGNGETRRTRQAGKGKGKRQQVGRAVADATALSKYVTLVVRPQAAAKAAARRAAEWVLRWRAAKRGAGQAAGGASSVRGAVGPNAGAPGAAAAAQVSATERSRNKVGAETAVGKRKHLFIGLNVVAALQRNECVGRSWRGVWGDG